MNAESIIIPILTFLLSALMTAFYYTVKLSNKLAELSSGITNMNKNLESVCASFATLNNKVENLSDRTTRLEAHLNVKSEKT